MKVGSALCLAPQAAPELVSDAVAAAMERAAIDIAGEVLLFLTHEFAREPQAAILAAARAARCTQVTGCTAVGVFNEDTWVLDAPAAVAMVFAHATPTPAHHKDAWRLTLVTPEALAHTWLRPPGRRCGGVASAASMRGPHAVWSAGRVAASGYCEWTLPAPAIELHVAPGLQPVSGVTQVTAMDGLDLLSTDHQPAWTSLLHALPRELVHRGPLPWYGVAACVTQEDPAAALASGRYEMVPVLDCDPAGNAVTLARHLPPATSLFWALRDPEQASGEWETLLRAPRLRTPACALLVSCLGRGAGFYGGHDRDWECVRERFPGLPFAGFYGNGEIAWRSGDNRLLQYSSVLTLMSEELG